MGVPSDELLLRDYLSFRPSLRVSGRSYALRKALELFKQVSGCGSLSEVLEKYRGGNDLHKALQLFVSRLESEGLKPKTILFYYWLLTSFLEFHDIDCSKANKKVKKPKKSIARMDKIPDIAMLQKMIYASKSRRLRMLIQLLAQTGLRLNEALQLRVSYIDFENNLIRLPGIICKNGKPREIPIIRELRESLQNYIKQNNLQPNSYLFPNEEDPSKPWRKKSVYDRWYVTLERIGLDERDDVGYMLHPHTLRKFFKTRLEMANVNRLLIMSWMGHDLGTQGAYFYPSQKDVEREVRKMEEALTIFGPIQSSEVQDLHSRVKQLEDMIARMLRQYAIWHPEDVMVPTSYGNMDYEEAIKRYLKGEIDLAGPIFPKTPREAKEILDMIRREKLKNKRRH
jgi:integrase